MGPDSHSKRPAMMGLESRFPDLSLGICVPRCFPNSLSQLKESRCPQSPGSLYKMLGDWRQVGPCSHVTLSFLIQIRR
jgi:hypothetical protein